MILTTILLSTTLKRRKSPRVQQKMLIVIMMSAQIYQKIASKQITNAQNLQLHRGNRFLENHNEGITSIPMNNQQRTNAACFSLVFLVLQGNRRDEKAELLLYLLTPGSALLLIVSYQIQLEKKIKTYIHLFL